MKLKKNPLLVVLFVGSLALIVGASMLLYINFSVIGQLDDGGYIESVYVSGSYAYIGDDQEGLEIIDISDPTTPVEVGQFDDYGVICDIYVSGSYAYLAEGVDGLKIIDISDPTAPVEVGHFDDGGYASNVHISGSYAYVADGEDGLEIIDISDPTTPLEVGQLDNDDEGYTYDVYVSGLYAYVANGDGLTIIDISDPTTPVEVGQLNYGGHVDGVYISGSYAYLMGDSNGFQIIDISDLANPVKVGHFSDDKGYTSDVFVSGSYVYVADTDNGLEIIDPWSPKEKISNIFLWIVIFILTLLAIVDLRYLIKELFPTIKANREQLIIIDSLNKGIDASKYYKHIVKSFLTSLYVLFFGLLFFFILIRMMPGNPYSLSEGNLIYDTEVTRLALDKNPLIQFFVFLKNLFTGNWGIHSYHLSNDVLVTQTMDEWRFNSNYILPYHSFLEIIFASIGISLIFGIFFGYLVSKFKNKKKGKIIRFLIILLWAIPLMGFGYIFSYIGFFLDLLPGCSGYSSHIIFLSDGDYITNFPIIDCLLSGKCFWERFLYLITPVSILNLIMIPIITYFIYKLIEHFKSSREIPDFTGNLGFFYSIIVTSSFIIGPIICTWDLTFLFEDGIYSELAFGDFFVSIYLFLITFFIFNLVFNIIVCGITLYLEKKQVIKDKISIMEEESLNENNKSVIKEHSDLETHPKKNKLQKELNLLNAEILIATIVISLLFFIIFLVLEKNFIIFLAILVIIICIPLIFKRWRLKLTSEKEIKKNSSNNNQKSFVIEESTIRNNGFSKWTSIIGSIFIIISMFGIAIYGWETSGKNIFKTQTILIISTLVTLISIIGVFLGFLSAFYGKWVKKVINNLVLLFITIPCVMILGIFIDIIGIANSSVIWIIGLISIPIVTHFTEEIISNEMKKNSIKPALFGEKNQNNSFKNIKHKIILPITGLLCFNVSFSIFLYEGYVTVFEFLDPSFISLGRAIHMCRYTIFTRVDPPSLFILLIPSFLLFLIMSGFILLGLSLFDYKRKKQ